MKQFNWERMIGCLVTVRITWIVAALLGMSAAAEASSHSSSIVLSADQRTLCAVNQDTGSISFWDWTGMGRGREVVVGIEPRTVALTPDGRLAYVSDQRQQTLVTVDVETGRVVGRIWIGGQPVGVVLSPDGTQAYVSQFAGGYVDGRYMPGLVAVVDLDRGRVATRIAVDAHPFALALAASGEDLYVTHYFHREGQGLVTHVNVKRTAIVRRIVLEADDDVAGGRGGIFNAISAIDLHPDHPRALVAGMHANEKRGLTQSGMALSHKTTVQAVVRVLDLAAGTELKGARIVSSFSGQAVAVPSAVAFLPGGEHFVDVYFASNDMKLLRYNEQGVVAERALLRLPDGPTGIALTADGRTAMINCRWARCVVQVSLEDIRRPRIVRRVATIDAETWDQPRLHGAMVFHNSRDTRMTPNRWLSCGACHLDGGLLSDRIVWEFAPHQKPGSPPRLNTPSLATAAWSGPPFLITGKFHSIQAEDNLVRRFLRGSGFCDDPQSDPVGQSPDMDAVAAYVLSLRPRPNPHRSGDLPHPAIRASVRRGGKLFRGEAGCVRCHAGLYLTGRGNLEDVGTGIVADVPTLKNLWATAPYLHDGRAKTLEQVITTYNRDDRHGRTSHLTESQQADLVHFLLAPDSGGGS